MTSNLRSPYFQQDEDGVVLFIKAQPGAKRTAVSGLHDRYIKIQVHSPPVDGKANEALITFIADELNVKKSSVTIQQGQSSKLKTISVRGINQSQVLSWLAGYGLSISR